MVEIQNAVEQLEEPDPTVYDHLGDILAEKGQMDQAVEAWLQAYELDPAIAVCEKLERAGHPMPEMDQESPRDE